MSAAAASGFVVPVGLLGGGFIDGSNETASLWRIRRGWDLHLLQPDAMRVWLLAHDRRDDAGSGGLAAAARAAGIDQPDRQIADLFAAGLLVSVDDDDESIRRFCLTHRVGVLQNCFGNSSDDIDDFAFGYGESVTATGSAAHFQVWQWAHRAASIEQAAVAFTGFSELRFDRSGGLLGVRRITLGLIRDLVARELAYVDPVAPGPLG